MPRANTNANDDDSTGRRGGVTLASIDELVDNSQHDAWLRKINAYILGQELDQESKPANYTGISKKKWDRRQLVGVSDILTTVSERGYEKAKDCQTVADCLKEIRMEFRPQGDGFWSECNARLDKICQTIAKTSATTQRNSTRSFMTLRRCTNPLSSLDHSSFADTSSALDPPSINGSNHSTNNISSCQRKGRRV